WGHARASSGPGVWSTVALTLANHAKRKQGPADTVLLRRRPRGERKLLADVRAGGTTRSASLGKDEVALNVGVRGAISDVPQPAATPAPDRVSLRSAFRGD